MQAPVWINPVDGVISSPGGLRTNPVNGKKEFHDGLDIACPVGTPVLATRSGTVLAAGVSATYGNYLKLAYDDGFVAVYAHLNSVSVSTNETVRQGQTVAHSGNTGRSTGPHLHYSVFQNGQYVNPVLYVSLPYNGGSALVMRGTDGS